MLVYVSGPMTGLPELNFPAFHRATALLRANGYDVVNPAELDAQDAPGETKPWHVYLRRDLAELLRCDVIAMLPGWRESRGARLEHHVATALGMHVVFFAEPLGTDSDHVTVGVNAAPQRRTTATNAVGAA